MHAGGRKDQGTYQSAETSFCKQDAACHDGYGRQGRAEKREYTVRIKKEINQAAAHNGPVLIEGEEGTGKKTIGTAIWKASQRAEKPFVYFNCASVEEGLLEERLFGATGQDKAGMGSVQESTEVMLCKSVAEQ